MKPKALLASLKGNGGKDLGKKNEQVEEIAENMRKGFWGLTFLHNTKPSSFEGTKKLYWRRVSGILEGLYEFFKFNLYCYIIFKITNIVIICINLSFFIKLVF